MKRSIFSTICRVVSILSTLALIGVLIFNVVLYFLQDSLIFEVYKLKPHMQYSKPANSEDIMFKTQDGYNYLCWLIKTPQDYEQNPVILYILGNGAYMENYVEDYEELVYKLNVNILGCSTRGSGTYEGKPQEGLLYSDAQMYLDFLTARFKYVFVYGKSMGGAVAVEMAYKNPNKLTGLIVENSFLSLRAMAQHNYPLMYFFTINYDWIIRTKMESGKKIRHINMPSLFNVSLKDKVVPPEHTQKLYEMSPSPYKYLYQSEDGTHNNVRKNDEDAFFKSYKNFVDVAVRLALEKRLKEYDDVNKQAIRIPSAASENSETVSPRTDTPHLRGE